MGSHRFHITLRSGEIIDVPSRTAEEVPYFQGLSGATPGSIEFPLYHDAVVAYTMCVYDSDKPPELPQGYIGEVALFADFLGAADVINTLPLRLTRISDRSDAGGDNFITALVRRHKFDMMAGRIETLCEFSHQTWDTMRWLSNLVDGPMCSCEWVLTELTAPNLKKKWGIGSYHDCVSSMMYVYLGYVATRSDVLRELLLHVFRTAGYIPRSMSRYPFMRAIRSELDAVPDDMDVTAGAVVTKETANVVVKQCDDCAHVRDVARVWNIMRSLYHRDGS